MPSVGTPIFVIIPDESEERIFYSGKVLEADTEMFVAEFDEMQVPIVGSHVQTYRESGGKFFQQSALVKAIGRTQPNPIITFQRLGPPESAEKRNSYRVRMVRLSLTGQIGGEPRCNIADISPEGFAAITSKALDVGSLVKINIKYETHVLEGEARLQCIKLLNDGKFRCGFMVPGSNARMRRTLERMSSIIQRIHLRTTARFHVIDSNVEVNGETIQALVQGMGKFRETALRILAKQEIVNPQPGEWYSQQAWLDALAVIADKVGPDALFNIGLRIPENALFPPGIDSLDKALSSVDAAFHMNHRNGLIGHYYFTATGPKSCEMVCENSYPCDFDRGLVTAICRHFKPKGSETMAQITHDDSKPCRKKGALSCTFLVTW
jgi:hypothetical protein